jgi:hypothetical protein
MMLQSVSLCHTQAAVHTRLLPLAWAAVGTYCVLYAHVAARLEGSAMVVR